MLFRSEELIDRPIRETFGNWQHQREAREGRDVKMWVSDTKKPCRRVWVDQAIREVVQISEAAVRAGAFAFPAGSLDAALLVNLAPGNYTAQVAGVGGTSGIALVEIYELP